MSTLKADLTRSLKVDEAAAWLQQELDTRAHRSYSRWDELTPAERADWRQIIECVLEIVDEAPAPAKPPAPPEPPRVAFDANCAACQRIKAEGFGPPHTASRRCESGKRAHCSCDICF